MRLCFEVLSIREWVVGGFNRYEGNSLIQPNDPVNPLTHLSTYKKKEDLCRHSPNETTQQA